MVLVYSAALMTSSIKIYSYPTCSTCRKAIAWLKDKGLNYELIDISIIPPTKDLLGMALRKFKNKKMLFNTSGKSYRLIGAKVVNNMTDEEALEALEKDGKLIKRPFIVIDESDIILGFKPEILNEKFSIESK